MAARARALSLTAPSRLTVENLQASPVLGEVITVSTLTPRFGFAPHSRYEHPGDGVDLIA